MALDFKVYEPTESKLVELGTVQSQVGKGGSISFTPGTLAKFEAGTIKALSILFKKKNGESVTCPLSKRVSATVFKAMKNGTKKSQVLTIISKLMVCESEEDSDLNVICGPRGAGGTEEELVMDDKVTKSSVSYADLEVAF